MAIPPIISNLPILKALRADQAESNQQITENPVPSSPEDVVDVSAAAQQRLDGIQELSLDKPEEIATTVAEARALIEKHMVALGLDPDFT